MFCASCGNSMQDGLKFCPACGAAVSDNGQNAGQPPSSPFVQHMSNQPSLPERHMSSQSPQSAQPVPNHPPQYARQMPNQPPPGYGHSGGYQGQPRDNTKIYVGIAVGVLLLAGIGFGIYSFTGSKAQPTEVAKQAGPPPVKKSKEDLIAEGKALRKSGGAKAQAETQGNAPAAQEQQAKQTQSTQAQPKNQPQTQTQNQPQKQSQATQNQARDAVNGIRLGMTPDQVGQKLGQPTTTITDPNGAYTRWYYEQSKGKGILVSFRGGGVCEVMLLQENSAGVTEETPLLR